MQIAHLQACRAERKRRLTAALDFFNVASAQWCVEGAAGIPPVPRRRRRRDEWRWSHCQPYRTIGSPSSSCLVVLPIFCNWAETASADCHNHISAEWRVAEICEHFPEINESDPSYCAGAVGRHPRWGQAGQRRRMPRVGQEPCALRHSVSRPCKSQLG